MNNKQKRPFWRFERDDKSIPTVIKVGLLVVAAFMLIFWALESLFEWNLLP